MSTSIITRRTFGNQAAVFLLDSLNIPAQTIQMWNPETNDEPQVVSLDSYRNTKPTSDADEEFMVRRFTEHFKPSNGVILRRRLYKDKDKAAQIATSSHTSVPVLHSVSNLQAQQRESSPQAAAEAAKPRLTMQEWEKRVLVESMINAATKAFAASMQAIMAEAMK